MCNLEFEYSGLRDLLYTRDLLYKYIYWSDKVEKMRERFTIKYHKINDD